MKNIICLKHGKKYDAEYVNILFNMVKRNTTVPHRFVCFTEDPTDLNKDIEVQPLPSVTGIKGWWYKPLFFNPDLNLKGTVLFLDLDVIVFQNIDKLFDYRPGEFCIIRDFTRHQISHWKKVNSSCFRFEVGKHTKIYDEFIKDTRRNSARFFGDQDWIYNIIKDEDFLYWPEEWIQSYKWEMRGKPPMIRTASGRNFKEPGTPVIKDETCIAVFHGEPNPKDCIDEWCRQHWR